MKCQYCGYEENAIFFFCPNCGQPAPVPTQSTAYNQNPNPGQSYNQDPTQPPMYNTNPNEAYCPTPRILALIKDGAFLTLCILLSISAFLTLFSGGFNILSILFTIFLWIVYADGRKNVVEPEHIKCVSGTLFATYIIHYITAGLYILLGVIAIALANNASQLSDLVSEITLYSGYDVEYYLSNPEMSVDVITVFAVVFGAVLLIGATLTLLLNILGIRKLHAMVKSVYKSGQNGFESFVAVGAARTTIIILTILQVLALLGSGNNIWVIAANACNVAVLVITNILISKYLDN